MPASNSIQIPRTVLDFALAGGPRCATTSLYTALRSHPGIGMPSVKEPHYLATDMPGCRMTTAAADYDALFRQTAVGQLRGEASTLYCYSKNALAEMLKLWPRLKVIVVVRNPIELFQSFHNHLLFSMIETEGDPELASGEKQLQSSAV